MQARSKGGPATCASGTLRGVNYFCGRQIQLSPLTTEWVVYAKRPFAGPEYVLAYLGRYTHRVALSNDRLLSLEDGVVRFRWRDYADHDRVKVMTLDVDEFLRRFLLHVLPSGFLRIRHFGLLANRRKHVALAHCRRLLNHPPPLVPPSESAADFLRRLTGEDPASCPVCHQGRMIVTAILAPTTTPRPSARPLDTS